jgi:hypothetical protein
LRNRPSTTTSASSRIALLAEEVKVDGDVRSVVGEQHRGVVGQGGLGIDHHGQRVVVDDDQLAGVDSLAARLGDHSRHDVADEADDAAGQWRAGQRRRDHRETLHGLEVEVVGGVHADDARHRRRLACVDRLDAGVGHRRAYERNVK